MTTPQTIEVAIVFNTAEKGLLVQPYPTTGGTVVTGQVDLALLERAIGTDRLLDAIGLEKAQLHFGLMKKPVVPGMG